MPKYLIKIKLQRLDEKFATIDAENALQALSKLSDVLKEHNIDFESVSSIDITDHVNTLTPKDHKTLSIIEQSKLAYVNYIAEGYDLNMLLNNLKADIYESLGGYTLEQLQTLYLDQDCNEALDILGDILD